MFCTACGAAMSRGSTVCGGCGREVPAGRGGTAGAAPTPSVPAADVPSDGPSAAREIVRRLAFHGGLLAAAAVLAWPGGSGAVAAGMAAVAVAVYVALPWPRRSDRVLTFSRGSAVIGPDILGLVLTGMFFVLPILIVADNAHEPVAAALFSTESGWIWLTAVMWFLAAICATIIVTALWYATFAVHLVPGGIVRYNLLGRVAWTWADTARAEPAHFELPRWVRIAARVVAVLNWRVAGAVLLGADATMNGLRLVAGDGRTLTLWADHMPEFPRIVAEMTAAGITLDPAVRDAQPGWFGDEEPDEEDDDADG